MKKEISTVLLLAALTGIANNPAVAQTLPVIDPSLNIHMPDAVYTNPSGEVFRLKADFIYLGVSERGTFLWEVKPDGYTILSNTTLVPPEVIDNCSSNPIPEGVALTLHNINNGVDYIINCSLAVNGDLTIDPGVTIQFGTDAAINVRGTGSIQALGTQNLPILLTGEDKTAGSWKGILS